MHGLAVAAPHSRPLDELVLTILSQSTNDRNRDVAFLRLRERFGGGPRWSAVRDAPVEEVERAIRPGGLSPTKSARIQAILRELPTEDDGEPTLDHLAAMPVARAREALVALPGVGRKTAACVLCFSFGMDDVPVDTHVGRVATRLGLLREGAGAKEQHDRMLALTPRGAALELHVAMLRHGRRLCHARTPECASCGLRRVCPSARP